MRFLIIAVSISALALATGAFAQTTPQSPAAAQTTPQSTPSLATGAGLDVMALELVYKRRQNALPAVPEQCCTCRRAPCLPWLSRSVPLALLEFTKDGTLDAEPARLGPQHAG